MGRRGQVLRSVMLEALIVGLTASAGLDRVVASTVGGRLFSIDPSTAAHTGSILDHGTEDSNDSAMMRARRTCSNACRLALQPV